jgi:protease-4
MKVEDVDKIARGRVWTGAQGKGIGLVDEIGGLDRALKVALELAGLDPSKPVRIVRFPEEKTLWQTLFEKDDPQLIRSGLLTEKIRGWINQPPSMQARMPFEITIR